ncbi:free fatty acid receptor 3 [Cricetulus griseus]|uniref:free fatty acid receptor 3 n=1 Tax=Cricetulus griseus TaxID=10029 RepID=UPI000F746532|nr:free fatty acid receptor 3 [Cricetulus griseus]
MNPGVLCPTLHNRGTVLLPTSKGKVFSKEQKAALRLMRSGFGFLATIRLRLTPNLVYTLHLGCSDLLLAITLPLKAVEALASGAWPLPLPFCSVFVLAHFAPLYASGGFLAALSAGRYLGAAFPFGFSILLFFMPLAITAFCYVGCLRALVHSGLSHKRKRKRVMGLLAATLLIFFVCFGPYNMSHVVGYVRGESPTWRSYVLLLSTLNSCIDPLVFYFSSSKFQADFQQLLGRLTRGCVPWTQEVSLELKAKNGEELCKECPS